jgi:hypothetical protein
MTGTEIIADRSRRAGGWVAIVGGGFFGAVSTAIGATALVVTIADPNPVSGIVAGVGGIFMLGSTVAVVRGVRGVWLSHLLGVPTLVLPIGGQLYLGGGLTAAFHRTGGTARARRDPRLTAELVCQEKVRYQQGTDTHTARREVLRRELAVTTDQVPDRVSGQVMIAVPVDVPPSIKLRHNEIVWSVQVKVRATGVPDDIGTFVIQVLPALAATVGEPR